MLDNGADIHAGKSVDLKRG
jgi:hypothetical protein